MMMLNWWRLWRRWCWYWWWWLTLWFSHRWWQWWWWFSQFCAIGAKPNQRVRLDNRLIGNFASGLRPSSWGSILWGDKVNFFANKLTQGNTFTNRLSQQSINFQADKVRFWLQKIIAPFKGHRNGRCFLERRKNWGKNIFPSFVFYLIACCMLPIGDIKIIV